MAGPSPRAGSGIYVRQLAWFVLAVVVPSLVVVGLGVRTIREQDELADKHAADERRLRANDVEHALVTRLETIRRTPGDSAVAITAHLVDGRFVMPWDATLGVPRKRTTREAVAEAEHDEFSGGRLAAAESRLRHAIAAGPTTPDSGYVRLLLARVLSKEGKQTEAAREYRSLLAGPLDWTDDNRIPLACYAAERLTDISSRDVTAVAALIDAALRRRPLLPPAAWYQLRVVAARFERSVPGASPVSTLTAAVDRRIADVEQGLAVQRDADALIAQWHLADTAWLPYGKPLWLIGLGAQTPAGDRPVLAVRAAALASSLSALQGVGGIQLTTGHSAGAERLGDQLPGLTAVIPDMGASGAGAQRAISIAALLIIVAVTLLGGYLLLRDVQREMQLADLRSQFVSSVSHELRTPLTAIRMFAETLQRDRADALARRDYLDTIVNESERLTRLLDNVLDFSQVEQGRKQYHREPASLSDIVRTAARAMAYPLAQHGFVLQVDADDTLPAVEVDADALEQAILNLLTNAMKYSGDSRTIDLRVARDGQNAVIAVRDQGIGIADKDRQRVFEKFYRAAGPNNDRIPGTGLGLTLVDHIVKAHGGRVEIESAVGGGSTFSIRLPLAGIPEVRL